MSGTSGLPESQEEMSTAEKEAQEVQAEGPESAKAWR